MNSAAPQSSIDSQARAELVARAMSLRPLVREHATQAEVDRRVPDEVIAALSGAGVFRLLTPRRYGGYQADLRTLTEVTEALGEADGSTSWVAMILAITNWLACLFPE